MTITIRREQEEVRHKCSLNANETTRVISKEGCGVIGHQNKFFSLCVAEAFGTSSGWVHNVGERDENDTKIKEANGK